MREVPKILLSYIFVYGPVLPAQQVVALLENKIVLDNVFNGTCLIKSQ